MNCKNCNDEVPEERWLAGYSYCMKMECVLDCMEKPRVAIVGVHKSNPQVVRLDSEEITRQESYMVR